MQRDNLRAGPKSIGELRLPEAADSPSKFNTTQTTPVNAQ